MPHSPQTLAMLRRNRRDGKTGGLMWVVAASTPAPPTALVETPERTERTAALAAVERAIHECLDKAERHPGEVALWNAVKAKLPDRRVPRSMFRDALERTGYKLPEGRRRRQHCVA